MKYQSLQKVEEGFLHTLSEGSLPEKRDQFSAWLERSLKDAVEHAARSGTMRKADAFSLAAIASRWDVQDISRGFVVTFVQ